MQQFPSLRGCSVDLNTSHFAPILSATTNFHLEDEAAVGQPLTAGDLNQNSNDQMGEYGSSKSPASGSSTLMPPSLDSLKSGMRDVPAWLKSLRLHKYTAMFAELSYEEMMKLDEAELERRNVTKGARTKILQSIRKLYCRAGDLRAMHERLSLSHPQRCLRCAIATLRQMIATPMIPYTPTPGENSDCVHGFVCISYINNQNLPGLIFNLLGEIQKAVFMSGRQPIDIEYEYLLMLFSIYDKLNNNEAFTPVQKQRVHQWKRLARKAIRPADVRHQRVGLPHSGKCEICHHKDMVHRERAKTSFKLNSGVPETSPYTHVQQQNITNGMVSHQFLQAAVEWSPFVQKPPYNANSTVSKEQRRQDVSCVGLSNFFVDSFHLETPKIRTYKTISASKPFTQSFPQYRSRPFTATGSSHAVPSLSSSSQMFGESPRWPRSIYENHQFLFHGDFACDTIQVPNQVTTSAASIWVPSSAIGAVTERGCESTSGYSSSTSERSSGAGSPRACAPGQTLYDRVCRDVAALQLSI